MGTLLLPESNSSKDTFEAHERIPLFGSQLKDVSAIVGLNNHALAAISCFASLSEGSLKIRKVRFHSDLIV
ncbi:MAG TPA: hypothetical protein VMM36_12440 [Opitutaceae bacterium]|nr:hypothetical protein [Opitutaceae bacterium]